MQAKKLSHVDINGCQSIPSHKSEGTVSAAKGSSMICFTLAKSISGKIVLTPLQPASSKHSITDDMHSLMQGCVSHPGGKLLYNSAQAATLHAVRSNEPGDTAVSTMLANNGP